MDSTQQSWQRVTELFEQALERPPEERSEFLKSACADDAGLLREVESLLAQHDAETGFLGSPAPAAMADQIAENAERLAIGKQLGQYRIEALLSRGGMGEVYVAEDRLGRKVALKLLTQRFPGDKTGTARFQQEARTLLALNHPHIVTIHDIDESEGVYYIASELVEGETLRRRLDEGEMRLEDVLEISNIWSLPLDGGAPNQLTDFKTDQIFWFDFSRDSKQLALSRGMQTSDVILIRDFR